MTFINVHRTRSYRKLPGNRGAEGRASNCDGDEIIQEIEDNPTTSVRAIKKNQYSLYYMQYVQRLPCDIS